MGMRDYRVGRKDDMRFLKRLFSGKTAEEYEKQGDSLFDRKNWGEARLAYEKALDKLQGQADSDVALKNGIEKKLAEATEALARVHFGNALEMIESECFEEARELLELSSELSRDGGLKAELAKKLEIVRERMERALEDDLDDYDYGLEEEEEEETEDFEETEETDDFDRDLENFHALIESLPRDVRDEYLGYGQNFVLGYIALNEEEFETAADYLEEAVRENEPKEGYIPMELATAYMNMDMPDEARELLEKVVRNRPDALPAYQLLCELYWEQEDFGAVDALLDSVPEDKYDTLAVQMLKGKNLYNAGRYDEAKEHYGDFLRTYGWNEAAARGLAKACEASGDLEQARGLYREMMSGCTGCGSRIDPFVKKKYADLSFAAGEKSPAVLEMYLSVAREAPETAADCYDKVGRIYEAQGNLAEAKRFRAFSKRARRDSGRDENF